MRKEKPGMWGLTKLADSPHSSTPPHLSFQHSMSLSQTFLRSQAQDFPLPLLPRYKWQVPPQKLTINYTYWSQA